ncbi:MAG TPA: 7TM-DISM domain-containing protein, partial [Cytophagaceae bacterium]
MTEKLLLKNRLIEFLIFTALYFGGYLPSFSTVRNVKIIKEETRSYSIEELIRDQGLFRQPYKMEKAQNEAKSFWLRFTYEKPDPEKLFYLFSPYIVNNKLDLYYLAKDSLSHYSSGATEDFEKRNLYLPSLYLKLPNATEPTVCWLHVRSYNGYHYFFVEREVQSIIEDEIKLSNFDFFLVGLSALACIFSLIFFIFLRDKLYIYYSIYSLMVIVGRLLVNGYIFNYTHSLLEFNTLESIFNFYTISYGLLNISLFFNFYEFLRLYKRSQRYHLWFYGFGIFRFLLSILFHWNTVSPYFTTDHRIYDLCMQLFLLVAIFRTSRKYIKL